MKVGISYGVELEDVPEEVENLLRDVQWDLQEKIEEIIVHVRNANYATLDDDIKNLRKNLARVDMRLEDCYTILVGYVNVVRDMATQAALDDHVASPPPSDEDDPND
jgi:hypothetical protein